MQFRSKFDGKFAFSSILAIERDRSPNIVDHNLARVARGEVLFEFVTDGRVDLAVNVVIQLQQ